MAEDEELDVAEGPGRPLSEYVEIPFRYPGHFVFPMVAVMIVAVLAVFMAPRKYRSSTLIMVESKKLGDHFVTPVTPNGIEQRLETIRQVVLSRTRLEAVIAEADPYPDSRTQPSHVVVERMRGAIAIRVQGRDSFSIEYVNNNPEKAMLVTDMLAQLFIEDSATLREDLTARAYGFIQSNLDAARLDLEAREQALREHKQRYWGSLPEQLETNLTVLQQAQFEQQTLGNNLRTLQERRAALERSLLEGRRLATSERPGPAAELARLRTQLAQLQDRYTDEHPDVKAILVRIERLEEAMADPAYQAASSATLDPDLAAVADSLEIVETEIESLNARRQQLDQRIAQLQRRVELTPRAEQELAALTRDYQQLRQNYDSMLQKEMDAQMARRMEEYWAGDYFRVLDPAYFPRRPIRPYAMLFVLAGVVLGIGAGLAAAVAADFLDTSVKSERDLEALIGLPILATIPHSSGALR